MRVRNVVGVLVWTLAAAVGRGACGDGFLAECAAKAAVAEKADTIAVACKDGWFFFSGELRHLGAGRFWGDDAAKASQAAKPEHADPLPAILDFQARLAKAGIELLLVPVPPKAIVYPDMLSDKVTVGKEGPPRLDAHHREFYDLLRRKGVKVLDLTDEFIAHRSDREGPVFCKQDSHWSGWGCAVAARRLAAEIKDRPWLAGLPRSKPGSEVRRTAIEGDLWQSLAGDKPPKETLWLRFLSGQNGSEPAAAEPDRQSPIVLLGDSHNLVFHSGGDMLAEGAGLAEQLALELGLNVDLVGIRGSGATPARVNLLRLARADPHYLERKKLVVWCFAAREFTESQGWQKVPVVK